MIFYTHLQQLLQFPASAFNNKHIIAPTRQRGKNSKRRIQTLFCRGGSNANIEAEDKKEHNT